MVSECVEDLGVWEIGLEGLVVTSEVGGWLR